MELNSKITKIGNSYGIIIPTAYVKTGLLQIGENYKVEIETMKEQILQENDLLKKKLKEANLILKKKGFKCIETKLLDNQKSSNKLFNKKIKGSGERI